MPDAIDAWLHIADDGAVTVCTGKVEIGQNIRTSLAQAVAEELKVAVGDIRLYTVEYIAHVPLEPRAAVAEWDGDVTVWTGTQRPFGVRQRAGRGVPPAATTRCA